MITCGFELETLASFHPQTGDQRLTHSGRVAPNGGTLDEAAFTRWVTEQVRVGCTNWGVLANNRAHWPEGHPFRLLDTDYKWQLLFQMYDLENNRTLETFLSRNINLFTREQYAAYKTACEAGLRTESNRNRFRPTESAMDFLRNKVVIDDLEIGVDGSVPGFEFRTLGGLDVPRFETASRKLFEALTHEVNSRCSFHVHVAIKGVKHKWSERLQQAMTEYVLSQMERVPSGVKSRWQAIGDNNIGQFFQPGVVDQKYAFVHQHKKYNTWEFRCFGNISSHADAMACLNIAMEAIQHAQKITSGDAKLLADKFSWKMETWQAACREAMANGLTIEQIANRFDDEAA